MLTKTIAALATAILALSASSCGTVRPEPMPSPIQLPTHGEPSFQRITYAALSAHTDMIVRLDTADVIAALKNRFGATLSPDRSWLSFQREELILSNGTPYRRALFRHDDSATFNMHGTCGQNIYVWFRASGEVSDVFVEPLFCPI